jgi:hypothetical protein
MVKKYIKKTLPKLTLDRQVIRDLKYLPSGTLDQIIGASAGPQGDVPCLVEFQ